MCYIIQPKEGSGDSSSEDEEDDESSEESAGRIIQEEGVAKMTTRKSSYKSWSTSG